MPTIHPITRPTTPRRMRDRFRVVLLGASVGLAALAGCYEDPQAAMDQAQQMTDMVDVVNELNARTSELSFTLDSLRNIVAKQDTTIWRLANLAGVPYQR